MLAAIAQCYVVKRMRYEKTGGRTDECDVNDGKREEEERRREKLAEEGRNEQEERDRRRKEEDKEGVLSERYAEQR